MSGMQIACAAAAGMTLLAASALGGPGDGVGGRGGAPGPAAATGAADAALLALLAEDLDEQMRANPVGASNRGDRRFDRLWPDPSAQAAARLAAADADRLERLRAIDRAALSPANRLNAGLLEEVLTDRLAGDRFHPEQIQITQQDGPQISLPQIPDTVSFTTRKQLEDYVARLEGAGLYIDGVIASMRDGLQAKRTPPRVVMENVAQQAGALLSVEFLTNPASHPMYRPLSGLDGRDELAVRAREAIQGVVTPAFTRLRNFLRDEYVPGCRVSIAASDGPDGRAFYDYLVRHYTTTDLTADQVHELGLGEVARIRNEMMETIAKTDFPRKNDLKGDDLFAAFVEYLRTDSRFYHQSPEALLTGYRDICKRMDAELPRLFGTLPRLSYGVREMPAFMSAAAPTAYYYPGSMRNGVSGTFIANTSALDQRPKYEMKALAFHESVPGHHLQISLSQELEEAGLPEWRETVYYTVFVEGWALYAERLGLEVGGEKTDHGSALGPGGTGFYEDPYDDFGRLSYEMWRALRLVVDTGIHAKGWTRERAIDYMAKNSALTRRNIESEVDRYIAMPGQALAYKIGQLKILELRAKAEKELGDGFDVRAFHDELLGAGTLPLGVLEERMDAWIASRRKPASRE